MEEALENDIFVQPEKTESDSKENTDLIKIITVFCCLQLTITYFNEKVKLISNFCIPAQFSRF